MIFLAQIQDTKITCITRELYEGQFREVDFMVEIPEHIAKDFNNYYYKNGEFKNYPENPHKEYYSWDSINEKWGLSDDLYEIYLNDLNAENNVKRAQALLNSDWTELPSALQRLGEAKVTEWQNYRQALRDITAQTGYPENIVWPQAPD